MTDLESRLHIAIGVAQSLQRPLWPTTPIGSDGVREMAEKIESALRDAVEEIRELRADRERLRLGIEATAEAAEVNQYETGAIARYGLQLAVLSLRRLLNEDAARAQAEGGGDGNG